MKKLIKRGDVYYVTWCERGRTFRRSTGERTLSRAREAARSMGAGPTLAEAIRARYEDASPATRARAVAVADKLGPLGHRPLRTITDADLDKVRESGKAPSTVRLELSIIEATMRANGVNTALRKPKPSPARTRFLTDDEVSRLKAAAPDGSRERVFLEIAFATGARKQAILDLTWDRVDLARRLITLLPEGEAQTSKRRPTVRMPPSLVSFLSYLPRSGDLVVPQARGSINDALDRIAAEAGVEGFTPHVARHTVATKLVTSGVPIYEVAKFLGCSVRMIEQTYGHWSPDHGEAAAAVLG